MPISQELQNNLRELCNATAKPDIHYKTESWISSLNETTDVEQLIGIWHEIIKSLNPEYYVARDNTAKFKLVQPHIDALTNVVTEAVATLSGRLEQHQNVAEDVTQFIFKVSNFYSIASTLDPDNFEKCSTWLETARNFITANNLVETKQHAIWFNLIGGHRSREYQMGRSNDRPNATVDYFRNAVHIRRDILGNSLDSKQDVDLRHVQMCLASTLMQDTMWLVLNGTNPRAPEILQACAEAKQLLAELTESRLVLADGTPDLYRRAGCVQAYSYIQIVEGCFQEACQSMSNAVHLMRLSIETTGATGQLSAMLNDEANALIALSAATKTSAHLLGAQDCLRASIATSEGQFEQMYADIAKKSLQQIEDAPADHPSVKLADLVMHEINPDAANARPRVLI